MDFNSFLKIYLHMYMCKYRTYFKMDVICSKDLNNDNQLGVKTLKRWGITDLDYPWKPGRKIK